MAAHGFGEGRLRGPWDDDDDRPRRKRSFPSRLEEEEEGWGGGGGPPGSLDKDDRERPPAKKARGRPWPDLEEAVEEEGRREGGRWGSPRGESGRGSREPPQRRGRSRSPPRGGQGRRGRGSPSPPRERAWRSPPSLGQTSRASRAKAPSSSSSSCSPGRDRRRGSPDREAPKGRSWESPPTRTSRRKRPLEKEEEGRQPPSPSRRGVERGRLERSSSSTSSYRSKRGPGWEARQEYVQDQSHRERDQYPGKSGGNGEGQRRPKHRDQGSSSYAGGERVWGSPSRGRRQESPAWGSPEWKKDREDTPSYSVQSHSDWDHRRRSWDSPEQKGKEQESWSRGDGLEMHHSSSEDPEDRDRSTGFEEEWILNKSRAVPKSLQGGLGRPEGRPKIYTGPDKHSVAPVMWVPRDEVVDFWNQCQSVMKKNVQDYLLSTCPRPTLPDKSCVTPELNPSIKALMTAKQVKAYSNASYYLHLIHAEVLNMLAPAMTMYEMAEESIEKQEPVDPLELREWARRVIRYIGSINQRLRLQRCSSILGAIHPRLRSMTTRLSGPSADGLLFAEDKVKLLKKIIQSVPDFENELGNTNVRNYYTVRSPRDGSRKRGPAKYGAHPQDAGAEQQELLSAQQGNTPEAQREIATGSLELWHRRFAHQDSKLILELERHNPTAGLKVDEGEADHTASCAVCLKIKGPRASSPPKMERRSARVMDLIHSDMYGPFSVPSLGNNLYVLIFVDDFSRYCLTYLLKEESEMHERLKQYINMAWRKFQQKPKAFQMGDGAEYLLRHSRDFLEEHGISHRRSDAQSTESGGTARREMRSLLEMTHCMLFDAALPDKFWGDAIMTATCLLNKLPVIGTGTTPFEFWNGQVPKVEALRVFGSLAYAYVPKWERHHLDPKREKTIFLGYAPRFRCYKVMNADTGEVSTRTVDFFDEERNIKNRETIPVFMEADSRDFELRPSANKD